jgi:hypothetical protein
MSELPQSEATLFATDTWFDALVAHGLEADTTPLSVSANGATLRLATRRGFQWPHPTELATLANFYSCDYGVSGEHTPSSQAALLAAVQREAQRFDTLHLTPLDPTSTLFAGLQSRFSHGRWRCTSYFRFGNWYADTTSLSYEDYLKRVPSSFPATCEKRRQAFLRKPAHRIEVVSHAGEALERAIDAYNTIYNASWKIPEPFPQFMPQLLRGFAKVGALRLGIAWVNDEPAAAQVWFFNGGKSLIYKVAYREEFAKLSVGSILSAHMFRQALDDDHANEIDYLSGDDGYKQKWMFARRERHALLAFNLLRPRGLLAFGVQTVGAIKRRFFTRAAAPTAAKPPSETPTDAAKD